MGAAYVQHVLGILRLIRDTQISLDNSAYGFIRAWTDNANVPGLPMRIASQIAEQSSSALQVVEASQLPNEAKAGLTQTLNGLITAFGTDALYAPLKNYIPLLETSISSFAILGGLEIPDEPLKEAEDLVQSIAKLLSELQAADLDSVVKSAAEKHLRVLIFMLQNLQSFGAEGALSAYFDALIGLRKAGHNGSEKARETLSKVWPEIERWAGRLTLIEGAMNSGVSVIEHMSKLPLLLQSIS